MESFKYRVTLLVKGWFYQENPHFFNREYCLPYSRVIFEDEVENFSEWFNFLVEWCDNFIVLSDLLPELISQLCFHLIISMIVEVLCAMHKQLIGESVLVIALWKNTVYQKIIVKGISPLSRFLRDNTLDSHFIHDLVLDSAHEFPDAKLKQAEYVVGLNLWIEIGTIF